MGYNTTIVVMNDAIDQIESDPNFGKNLAAAVRELSDGIRDRIDVPAGNHVNAAHVVETHHADQTAVVTVGGNLGVHQHTHRGWRHHELQGARAIAAQWANAIGADTSKSLRSALQEIAAASSSTDNDPQAMLEVIERIQGIAQAALGDTPAAAPASPRRGLRR